MGKLGMFGRDMVTRLISFLGWVLHYLSCLQHGLAEIFKLMSQKKVFNLKNGQFFHF